MNTDAINLIDFVLFLLTTGKETDSYQFLLVSEGHNDLQNFRFSGNAVIAWRKNKLTNTSQKRRGWGEEWGGGGGGGENIRGPPCTLSEDAVLGSSCA